MSTLQKGMYDLSYGCTMNQKLCFKLFGNICVLSADHRWVPVTEYSVTRMGKKQQAFLAYLLLNHNQSFSSRSLIDNFWSDDGKDPANSLKNMMHKTRALLRSIFPDEEDLIVTCSGGYEWRRDLQIEVDTDLFEKYYHEAKSQSFDLAVSAEQQVFDLYTGMILPGASLDWLDHRNTYYQTIYIDICKSLALRQLENERWNDAIYICEKAYQLAPELEEFTICQMQALINLGMPNQAIKHYEDYCVQLWKNYSLQPSNTVEQVHSLALHALYDSQDTIEKIVNDLGTLKEQDYSFQCSLPVFRNIVQLELRQLVRSQQPSSLAVMKIVSAEDTPPTSTDIRRLERVLLDSLRTGDPFTRLNQGAFILLLPGASEENSHKVMARVKNNFYSAYPRSTVTLQHKVFPLSVDQEEGNLILAGELE